MKRNNKKIIGITGGSGSGKSTFCRYARKKGFATIDADVIGHKIILYGNPAYNELLQYFGKDILGDDNEINRKELGKIVFSNAEKLNTLNEITHKYISEEIIREINDSKSDIIFLDAAVLHNSCVKDICDTIVAIIAPKADRVDRIAMRDAISIASAERRIDAQMPDEEYEKIADYVIHNTGDVDSLFKSMEDVIKEVSV